MVRGITCNLIFYDDVDRNGIVERLAHMLSEGKASCYAFAFLSNHVHLLLRTGVAPVARIMSRLLTGYAVSFNKRHKRSGHLFQNRYKSILCEEEPYLLELVRYIHLNPLRAQAIRDLGSLDSYPYAGHSAIMGRHMRPWLDDGCVLTRFSGKAETARTLYRSFVEKGIFDFINKYVARLFNIDPGEILLPGKHPNRVAARSTLCYFLVRELGMTATAVADKLGMGRPAVSLAVRRGEAIAKERRLSLPDTGGK
jgi:REP element-mobilizing transposase RayT